MRLKDLQERVASSITTSSSSSDFLNLIEPGGRLPTAQRAWEVYLNGYPARLSEALGETFEAVWRVLGDEEFFALCEKYMRAHPSENYNLSNYGKHFAEFLSSSEPTNEFPFLPELAEFEWEFHELFHKAPDELRSWSVDELTAVDENTRFEFIPSLKLFRFRYSTYSIWKKRKDEQTSFSSALLENNEACAMFKVGNQLIKSLSLQQWQYSILFELSHGKNLQGALESLTEENDIATLFSLMIQNGLIADLRKG